MILKSLREKSNQKHINKLLNSRQVNVNDTKIASIGILLNVTEFDNFEAFREFAEALNVRSNKIKIAAFTEDEKNLSFFSELIFNDKDIGRNAKIKNPDLQDFISNQFDILLCYFNDSHVELNLVTALSKAHFKVGIAGHDQRLYDFIIETKSKNFDIYKNELVKYLRILNKLEA